MKTKICPCCDQPITGIYCRGCRKIVLNPAEQDVKYYLNTRHPQNEHDCTFHGDINPGNTYRRTGASDVRQADHKMTASESERKKAEIRARMENRNTEQKKSLMTGLIVGLVIFMMMFSSIIIEIMSVIL